MNCGLVFLLIRGNRSHNPTKPRNPKQSSVGRILESDISAKWRLSDTSIRPTFFRRPIIPKPFPSTNTQTMIKTDKIRKPQPAVFYIIDYLWSGFAGLSVAMVVVALWAWGSAVFGEFMLPAPVEVFQKSLDLLKHFQENEIGISLWRSVVGISVALAAGLAAGLVAGSFKTAMALLKPVITILLAMPPIIWVVMALFWFGFGNPSVLFTIIVLVAPLTFASAAVGMASVNKQHEELFDAYKLGRLKKIRYLYIPHLTGYVISSIGVAVAMGVKVVIMAELLGASEGVGARIADARAMLETSTVMAYVVLVIVFVSLFEYLITKPLEILFMPWRR